MLTMKRLLLGLTIFCSAATSITGCKNADKRVYSDYPSFQQAESACNSWKKKGGTWELKVDEFRISAGDADLQQTSQFPIKVESTDDKSKEDLTSQEEEQELTIFLPLLTTGNDRSQDKQIFKIETVGEKWVKYNRRLCRIDDVDKNIILGKEYSIDSGKRVLKSNIPMLRTKQTFLFYK